MIDINRMAKTLGSTQERILAGLLELKGLGLISMWSLGDDYIAVEVHPLETLKSPRRDVRDVVRSYQL